MFLVMLKPLPRWLALRRSSSGGGGGKGGGGSDASRAAGMLSDSRASVHPAPEDASRILAV